MDLHSEGKPLVETLVDFFDEVAQQNFERRVFLLLDAVMRGQEIQMSESNTESEAPEATQGSAETVEGDQVVVNEASPGTDAPEAPEAPEPEAPADPSGDEESGDPSGESEAGDAESDD